MSPSNAVVSSSARGLTRLVVLSAVALIVVAWCSVAAVLILKRQEALDAEFRQNTNLASALEEQTARVLAAADQATLRLRDAVKSSGGVPADLARYANETGLVPNILVQLSLIDADGRFLGSNLDPDRQKTGSVSLATRDHVRVHLAADGLPAADRLAQPDDLYVGKPVLGRVSGKWTIQLSRRIVNDEGRFLGVVVASLDPGYFEGVFRRVSLGAQGGATLIGKDFNIRSRVVGGDSRGMGTTLAASSDFGRNAVGVAGHYLHASSLDGVVRITAYRQVAGFPLFLLVSTSESEALDDWYATLKSTLALTVLLSFAVIAGAATFVINVRRLERSNEALRLSEARAQSANAAKTEFLAAMSHELRTPLTSIRGFAELMELRLEDPNGREQAGLIRRGAEHLNDLLTEILDFAKVEAGAMTLVEEPVELEAILRGTADFFALVAAEKSLTLEVLIERPLARACGDSLRVKQILNNLVSNALKFTSSGTISIIAVQEGPFVNVHVDDTGPGVQVNLRQTVFERFRQGDARVSHEHGGTGLGLALSRAFAELMTGTLEVTTAPLGGARFTLKLRSLSEPVCLQPVNAAEAAIESI
jgi:signal transduction histidine kinase